MSAFDYKLFHTLFDNLWVFRDAMEDGPGGEEYSDYRGNDISACTRLSIFSQLGQISNVMGENLQLMSYREQKNQEQVTGAQGIMITGMDWADFATPTYYFEFGHFDPPGPEEYVRELHLDAAVLNIIGESADAQYEGSQNGRDLIEGAIGRTDMHEKVVEDLLYKCIAQSDHAEVWKVGFHDDPYQVFMTADSYIAALDETNIFNLYFHDKKVPLGPPQNPMDDEAIEKTAVWETEPNWFNKGVVDLDPERTAQKNADQVYATASEGKYEAIDREVLTQSVPRYSAEQIANLMTSTLGKEGGAGFKKELTDLCAAHSPDTLTEAQRILSDLI